MDNVCERAGVVPVPCSGLAKVGLSRDARHQTPLHGMRVRPGLGVTGWFIWAGEYRDDADFFEPVHALHLSDVCPLVVPFLALPPGWRFLVDASGYSDVWYDEALLESDWSPE
jgi:hypothetical protein